jgi:uncharacterized protein YqjF (DUF2071 family)
MAQTWERLLFAHWPLSPRVVQPHVPRALTLQTFEGHAWLGVTPFVLSVLRPRAAPRLPCLAPFPEVNVRTYVTLGERPGVFFFSLDAGSALAVAAARAVYSLPYFRAQVRVRTSGLRVKYASRRTDRRGPPAELDVTYGPVGPVSPPARGTLAYWLTERYCLYAVSRRGRVRRAEIHHAPWPLQPAGAEIRVNTLTGPLGIDLTGQAAITHFAERLDVHVWPPQTLRDAR